MPCIESTVLATRPPGKSQNFLISEFHMLKRSEPAEVTHFKYFPFNYFFIDIKRWVDDCLLFFNETSVRSVKVEFPLCILFASFLTTSLCSSCQN